MTCAQISNVTANYCRAEEYEQRIAQLEAENAALLDRISAEAGLRVDTEAERDTALDNLRAADKELRAKDELWHQNIAFTYEIMKQRDDVQWRATKTLTALRDMKAQRDEAIQHRNEAVDLCAATMAQRDRVREELRVRMSAAKDELRAERDERLGATNVARKYRDELTTARQSRARLVRLVRVLHSRHAQDVSDELVTALTERDAAMTARDVALSARDEIEGLYEDMQWERDQYITKATQWRNKVEDARKGQDAAYELWSATEAERDSARQSRARLVRLVRAQSALLDKLAGELVETACAEERVRESRKRLVSLVRHLRAWFSATAPDSAFVKRITDERDAARAWAAGWRRKAMKSHAMYVHMHAIYHRSNGSAKIFGVPYETVVDNALKLFGRAISGTAQQERSWRRMETVSRRARRAAEAMERR